MVDSGEQGDWFQIHILGKAEDGVGFLHTHSPQLNTDGVHISYTRIVAYTISEDIDFTDALLRFGK